MKVGDLASGCLTDLHDFAAILAFVALDLTTCFLIVFTIRNPEHWVTPIFEHWVEPILKMPVPIIDFPLGGIIIGIGLNICVYTIAFAGIGAVALLLTFIGKLWYWYYNRGSK